MVLFPVPLLSLRPLVILLATARAEVVAWQSFGHRQEFNLPVLGNIMGWIYAAEFTFHQLPPPTDTITTAKKIPKLIPMRREIASIN